MLKSLKSVIILVILLVVMIFIFRKMDLIPSWKQVFSAAPLTIDKTPVLIKEINELASLITVTGYDEVVVDSISADPAQVAIKSITGLPLNPFSPLYRKLVLIAKGQVICGTDLKKMTDSSVRVFKDSVAVTIPRAEVLDVIINPSGFETFIETGDWSDQAIKAVKVKARNKMRDRAMQQQLTAKANQRAVMLMTSMLQASGFKKVSVSFH